MLPTHHNRTRRLTRSERLQLLIAVKVGETVPDEIVQLEEWSADIMEVAMPRWLPALPVPGVRLYRPEAVPMDLRVFRRFNERTRYGMVTGYKRVQ